MPVWDSFASWYTPTMLFCFLNLMIVIIFITSNLMSSHNKQQQHHHLGEESYGLGQPLVRPPSILERVKSLNLALYGYGSEPQPQPPPFAVDTNGSSPQQAPSLLERVKSINLAFYGHGFVPQPEQQQTFAVEDNNYTTTTKSSTNSSSALQLARAPSLLERVKSIDWSPYRSEQPDPDQSETVKTGKQTENEMHELDHHVTRSKSDKRGKSPANVQAKMKKSASEKKVKKEKEEEDDGEDFHGRRRPATVRERNVKESETGWFLGEDKGVDEKADEFINKFRQHLKLQRLDSILRYNKEMLNRGVV